jgi:hypothetical protein
MRRSDSLATGSEGLQKASTKDAQNLLNINIEIRLVLYCLYEKNGRYFKFYRKKQALKNVK